ncbi:magnesium transporter MgtE N-terminal domain-containing protein [Catenulispora pinisilvae]|uniref:magnesium transporter MgtE N-terminal domain-containing protein n=1 Tax=Catenulispora pinisilvae TaxID=2705253 RepID=UPI0018926CA1|nr:CBS domain-containing protein [Catenulispora pinisilvae]
MSALSRVYVSHLAGRSVFDADGDPVGRIRDIVVGMGSGESAPRVLGLVLEMHGRRRVFLPIGRVKSIDNEHVVSSGLVNMRHFQQRPGETLVLTELLDRQVQLKAGGGPATVRDVAIEPERGGKEIVVSKLFVQKPVKGGLKGGLRRRGESLTVDWDAVTGLAAAGTQGAAELVAALDKLHAADLAQVIHELTPRRRGEVAAALDDDRLADVLEELPEDDQVEILGDLESERAADVLEAMDPDDAADLLGELSPEEAERLLALMEPQEANPVRRLLTYREDTAGGLMNSDPIILPPNATVAEALALVRDPERTPANASLVFVTRAPTETPTGRYLGAVHIQRLLREPPMALAASVVDLELEPLPPEMPLNEVTAYMATYNLVAAPVVDTDDRLLGAVTVDDVLDHLLPDDWRKQPPGHAHDELQREAREVVELLEEQEAKRERSALNRNNEAGEG